jgi:hypothetical protein
LANRSLRDDMQAPPTVRPVQAQPAPIVRAGPQIRPQPAMRPVQPTSYAPQPPPVAQPANPMAGAIGGGLGGSMGNVGAPAPSRDQNGNDLNAQRPVVGPASASQVHAALAANDAAVAAAPRPATPAPRPATPAAQAPSNDLARGVDQLIRPRAAQAKPMQDADDASQ